MQAKPNAERSFLFAIGVLSAVKPEKALEELHAAQLSTEDFENRALGDVFLVASQFVERGSLVELFALEGALAPSVAVKKAGGRQWLSELLMERSGDPRAIREYADQIHKASARRKAKAALLEAMQKLDDPELEQAEVHAMLADAVEAIRSPVAELGTGEGAVLRLAEALDAAQSGRRALVVPTGVRELDAEIGGLQASVLTMLGALPGVGKSALLASMLRNMARAGTKVGFFSLEDEGTWLPKRFLALEAGVPLFVLTTRPLTKEQSNRVHEAQPRVYELMQRIVLDERPGLTPQEVVMSATQMVTRHGVKAILVDHLGEIRTERSERYDLDVGETLSMLRDVAKRYSIPVVVAAHVKRRQGLGIEDPPSLTDFANSSAPERISRVALGLSKPSQDRLVCTVLKQTNGMSGQDVVLEMHKGAAMVLE